MRAPAPSARRRPDRRPLVLVGALGTTTAVWDPQLPALAARLRIVPCDLRGHGVAPPAAGPCDLADLGGDVLAQLDRLGLERVSFCGISLGGMVGLWLAAHAPERIDRLVVCSASPFLPPAEAWLAHAAAVRAAGSTAAVADTEVARWVTPAFARGRADELAALRAQLVATAAEGYAACCEAIARADLRDALAAIRAPTLAIAAAGDPVAPPSHGGAIADAIPGARLLVLRHGGHLVNVEQPATVGAAIVDHVVRARPR